MIGPMYSAGAMMRAFTYGSSMWSIDREPCGISAGFSISSIVPSVMVDVVLDVRHRRDEVEIELALEPLLHDLHVQQAEEAAAEAEAERGRRLGLVVAARRR